MEPVSLILGALAAGATAVVQETATQAVKDAYADLTALVKQRFSEKPKAEAVLADYVQDPETWEKPLQKSLVEVGADKDEEVVRQAQQVIKLVNPQQASQGKYNVQIGEAKGVITGDNASQTNTFGKD